MQFHFYLLVLLVVAAPFIIVFVTWRICRDGLPDVNPDGHGNNKSSSRKAHFYPTQHLDRDDE